VDWRLADEQHTAGESLKVLQKHLSGTRAAPLAAGYVRVSAVIRFWFRHTLRARALAVRSGGEARRWPRASPTLF
jgi:hypothetical protein